MDARLRHMSDFKVLFDASAHRHVIKHVRHRNALLPIGKLPTELLQTVFSLVLFTPGGQRKTQFVSRLVTLRAVSWCWQDLIGRTPSFWAHVTSDDHMDFIAEAFKRSGGVPIHLEHIGKYQDGQESPFLDQVLPHVHRWESLTIHQPNVNVAAKYFSVSAPKIKVIRLSSLLNGSLQQGRICSLFGGELASLDELRVYFGGDLDWRGISCTRLRVLDIARESSLDMDAVLEIIAANPYLENLRLHNLTFVQHPGVDPIPAPISLNHLKKLAVTDINWAGEDAFTGSGLAMANLLQRIRFPTSVVFAMKTNRQTGSSLPAEKLLSLIPSPVEYLAYLSQIDDFRRADVNVELGGSHLLLSIRAISRSDPIFSVEVDGLPGRLARDWVAESLRQAGTTSLTLRLNFWSFKPGFSLDDVFYFQLWESVTDLTLTGNSSSSPDVGRNYLRLLSTPCMVEDGSMAMPFPKLQNLHISRVSGIKGRYMLAMVQARFASPGSAESAVHNAVPIPLTIHCGDGVGGWVNQFRDRILAVDGVNGITAAAADRESWIARRRLSSLSEPEWPPLDGYHPFLTY